MLVRFQILAAGQSNELRVLRPDVEDINEFGKNAGRRFGLKSIDCDLISIGIVEGFRTS